VESFLPPNEILEDHLAAGYGRRTVLNLRSGESYTRHWSGLDGGKPDPRFYRPLRGKDVDAQKNIRGNGLWRYAPDLRNPATRSLVYSDSGVTWTKEGVRGPGQVVFKVSAANVVTSARLILGAGGAGVSVSTDAGAHWTPTPVVSGEADLPEAVAGQTEYLVKVELEGAGSVLSTLVLETITQLNRPALPRLVRGPNRVQVRLGRQVETITLAP